MQQNRPKLSLRHASSDHIPTSDVIEVLKQAIDHHLCVRASNNRDGFILAPHILYERRGQPYLDAVTIERGGSRPGESKLDTFKQSGLRSVVMTSEPVALFPGFDLRDERYREQVIAAIEA